MRRVGQIIGKRRDLIRIEYQEGLSIRQGSVHSDRCEGPNLIRVGAQVNFKLAQDLIEILNFRVLKRSHRCAQWRLFSHTSDWVQLECHLCGVIRKRDISAEERALLQSDPDGLDMIDSVPTVHDVWNDFQHQHMTQTDGQYVFGPSDRGYPLMKDVEAWAKSYPNDVSILKIDDGSFSTSSLVLIEHQLKDQNMGTTAVVIPQHKGPPVEFFMYPRNRQVLIDALVKSKHASRKIQQREHQARRKWSEQVDRLFKNG